MKSGLGLQTVLPGTQFCHQRHQQPGHLFPGGAAHIENLNGAGFQYGSVMGRKTFGRNLGHILRFTQTRNSKGILPAKNPQQTVHGIGPLVIQLRFNGGDQIFLLTLHKGAQESAVLQR